jgi:hypothetical protein
MPINLSNERTVNKPSKKTFLEKLSIEYELNINDLMAYYSYILFRSSEGRARMRMRYIDLAISIVLLGCTVLIWIFIHDRWLTVVIGTGAVLMFFYSIYLLLFVRIRWKKIFVKTSSDGRNRLIGKHKLSITPTAITDITDVGESTILWGTVESVIIIDTYLFITGGLGPYILPQKAFPSSEAFKEFAEVAATYSQAAK